MFKWLVMLHTPYLLASDDDLSALGDITDEKPDDTKDDDKPDDKSDDDKPDDEEKTDDDLLDEDNKEDDEDNKEDEEKDEEDKEDDEEDKEDEQEDRITHASELKKAYPDIFKKFPDVKAALYRDQRYSEILGSPKEAENIVNKASILDQIDEDLTINGDPKRLMETIKKNSAESFTKIAYNFLPILANIDKEAYLEIVAVPIKQLLRNMVSKFDEKSNEYKAALYVHQYFFDDLDVRAKVRAEDGIKTEKSAKEKEYEQKIQQIDQRDQNNFFESTNVSYVTRLSKVFREGLDKDDRLTDFMRNVIVEKGLSAIKNQLDNDPRFKRQMESLWAQGKSSGYSNDLKSRIISTALARAKSLVPKERARLLAEALGKKVKKDVDEKSDKKVTQFERRDSSTKRSDKSPSKPLTDIDLLRGRG